VLSEGNSTLGGQCETVSQEQFPLTTQTWIGIGIVVILAIGYGLVWCCSILKIKLPQ
jgi:hypothetical protein